MGNPTRTFVEGSPQATVTPPAQTAIGTTAAKVLDENAKRKGLIVQNTGLTTIKLSFGETLPTQTAYHLALKACGVADDGSGAAYFESSWVGIVNAVSDAPGGTCVMTQFESGSPDWDRAGDWGIG